MRKPKIGVLTFSDGREFIHRTLVEMNQMFQRKLRQRLEAAGYEVVAGRDIIWTNHLAVQEAKRLTAEGAEATVFNYAVWSFPHLTALAQQFVPRPILLLSNVNPQYPGLVAMLAAAGALNQVGTPHFRVAGDVGDDVVFQKIRDFVAAAISVTRLRGETYGLIGGRSIGIYTAVSNADQWMEEFGIDVEHIDQLEIVERASRVPADKVESALEWCQTHVGKIHYDGRQLTPEKLKLQIRTYYATRELIDQYRLDFCGIKGQPELTNRYCTMDITEAFLNDPYDFDGPKEIIVCSTEADMDAALTMEIFKHMAQTPVLFADVRHYHEDLDLFDLVNSGQHATYFAGRSFDPLVNLPKVEFYPQGFYFPAGGASVQHLAAPGDVTLARLTRRRGRYWMAALRADFVQFDAQRNHELMEMTQLNWPHAFARLHCPAEAFLNVYSCNHIHGVYGDWMNPLEMACQMAGIEFVKIG